MGMSTEKMRASFRLLMLIATPKLTDKALLLFEKGKLPMQLQAYAHGTASREMMDMLGLDSGEKSLLLTMMPKTDADDLLIRLRRELRLGLSGSGIAFTVPISGANKRVLQMVQQVCQEKPKPEMRRALMQENDYQIMKVAESLYQNFQLKRVFYSAFVNVNHNSNLPTLPGGPPLLREHRLYQADWLLRVYGFSAGELLSEDRPDFNIFLDPKCDWALRHLEAFPVEINRADYNTLLRVPGIGVKSANRIVKARRHSRLDFSDLKKIGVVLKRAAYFITCSGRMMYSIPQNEDYICSCLMQDITQIPKEIRDFSYKQISFFDEDALSDFKLTTNDLCVG